MKKSLLQSLLALSFGAMLVTACGDDKNPNPAPEPEDREVVEVPPEISADTTWTADKVYLIKQNTFVSGGTLTIEPGTVVTGEGSSALVISRDAKINAVGTAERPIVMTSAKVEGERTAGDWGGLVMLGRASINASGGEQQVEGFPANTPNSLFGGGANPDDTHDCGTLNYVRIEFAGYVLSGDNETNGLTIAGCGSDTEIDYVQVHRGSDDGVEIFGGAVNIKHVVISQGWDDSLDWDLGWTGKAQFVVIQQDPVDGNYGFEADSNGSTPNQAPVSNPELYNVTLVGSKKGTSKEQGGMLLREGTGGRMGNFILTGFSSYAINVAGQATIEHSHTVTGVGPAMVIALKPEAERSLHLKGSMFFQNGWDTNGVMLDEGNVWPPVAPAVGSDGKTIEKGDIPFDQQAFFELLEYANTFDVDPRLQDAYSLTAPNFAPAAGSPALTGGATPPDDGFFDTTATFRGAIGTVDWTAGWTAYPEN